MQLPAKGRGGNASILGRVMRNAEFSGTSALLTEAPGLPIEVYCYWPDGHRHHMEFDRWPQREDLPIGAVRFDIAWPDPRVVTRLKTPNAGSNGPSGVAAKVRID